MTELDMTFETALAQIKAGKPDWWVWVHMCDYVCAPHDDANRHTGQLLMLAHEALQVFDPAVAANCYHTKRKAKAALLLSIARSATAAALSCQVGLSVAGGIAAES